MIVLVFFLYDGAQVFIAFSHGEDRVKLSEEEFYMSADKSFRNQSSFMKEPN